MKQSPFFKKFYSLLSSLNISQPYVLNNFHPGLFLSLYRSVAGPVLLLVGDAFFDSVLKYFSPIVGDEGVVFIPPFSIDADPIEEASQGFLQKKRSREILGPGLGSVSFILCAESGFSVPLVGSDVGGVLDFSSPVDFDVCLSFLSLNDYCVVDVVVRQGQYCIRGGIIDVFPFSFNGPVRLVFLNDGVDVFRFDIESQLTTNSLKSFCLASVQNKGLAPLKDAAILSFVFLLYKTENVPPKGAGSVFTFSDHFSVFTYKDFINNGLLDYKNIDINDNLTSVGVLFGDNLLSVPPWFVGRKYRAPSSADVPVSAPAPLSVSDIKKGDFLVHRDHGIGRCLGFHIHDNSGKNIQEFISIKYEDGVLRLDMCNVDLISYYAAAETSDVRPDSLKKRGLWNRGRRAARRRAEETIEYLLNLYVRRNDIKRTPFPAYHEIERQFLFDFPYTDTPDQDQAWNDISKDLTGAAPMDRLLCGDVGFGKTEIAMRAAFRCVLGKKRVVVLAPTTILANQLFVTFVERLGAHAVSCDVISRFRSLKEVSAVQNKIIAKNNDVLVGTHSLLNNDVYLKNIGLLIIDEEHRFGVAQKEKIKHFKGGVDVLSMSATPIPRSMNLVLSGIYSISLLQTPPLMRLPIITCIKYFNYEIICEAITFETSRGGQVYFVHNDIQSIKHITKKLCDFFPKLLIMYIHGQEAPRDIEKKMSLFVSGNIHVLVCTSIIEAGIDVPNVNCILINNSHLFGLSQLYQIRGRVGRGSRQAYAYLLVPGGANLSNKAHRRLKTIIENTRLGSGYNISKSDMDQRGGGALFGYKQAGGAGRVGYEMYLRLIQRSLHESGKLNTDFLILPEDVTIEVFGQRHIPEEYIGIGSLRLSFYKNLASSSSQSEIDSVVYNITNRFGPVPTPLNNLILEYRLRLLASAAGISSIKFLGCGYVFKLVGALDGIVFDVFFEFMERFFQSTGVEFHLLPGPADILSACIHISDDIDKYSLLSQFLDKFKSMK